MMGAKALFGLFAIFLLAVHFTDAQGQGKQKCKRVERYGSVGNDNCGLRRTEWKTVIEHETYRIDCRCRGGFLRIRECRKCIYPTPTTTVAPTQQPTTGGLGDESTFNPVTSPATEVPSTPGIPETSSPNPGPTEAPGITSENPLPPVPPSASPI